MKLRDFSISNDEIQGLFSPQNTATKTSEEENATQMIEFKQVGETDMTSTDRQMLGGQRSVTGDPGWWQIILIDHLLRKYIFCCFERVSADFGVNRL